MWHRWTRHYLSVDDVLRQLAEAYGVATQYVDQAGVPQQVRVTTVLSVLAALDVDTSSPESLEQALAERRLHDWHRILPPVVVSRQTRPAQVWVHVPHGTALEVWVEIGRASCRERV